MKLIYDEKKLKDFIDWLPELEVYERYYIDLFAKQKYNPVIKGTVSLQVRFSAKENLIEQIREIESFDFDVPEDSLALYISLNPISLNEEKNIKNSIVDNLIKSTRKLGVKALREIRRSTTSVSTSISKVVFFSFDVDPYKKDFCLIDKVLGVLQSNQFAVIETVGGFHFIVKTNLIDYPKNWYYKLFRVLEPDQKGDLLSPIPGCIQSNFVPKFIKPRFFIPKFL